MELLSKSGAKNSPYLTLGKIVAAHGLRGALKVFSLSDFPERLLNLTEVYLTAEPDAQTAQGPFQVEQVQVLKGKNYLVFLEEIQDRDQAEEVSKYYLALPASEPFSLPEDTFYARDLIGFRALTNQGEVLGEIIQVIQSQQDLLVLKTPDGKEHWVPFVFALVPEIRTEAHELVIEVPEGLLEL